MSYLETYLSCINKKASGNFLVKQKYLQKIFLFIKKNELLKWIDEVQEVPVFVVSLEAKLTQ